MSSDGFITILLDHDRENYRPGELLAGRFTWQTEEFAEAEAAELSVLWTTEGKGDEDLGVHHFERLSPAPDTGQEHRFSVRLPPSPLSYEGWIVKIYWTVRVRVFLQDRGELLGEAPFRLGDVPRPQEVVE